MKQQIDLFIRICVSVKLQVGTEQNSVIQDNTNVIKNWPGHTYDD